MSNFISKPPPSRPPIDPGMANDAFGRLRVSNPTTLFDSKQIFDNGPLYWDDEEVSGGSTSSNYSVNRASSILGVGDTAEGNRVRQTFQRWNYQPGKSLLVLCTGIIDASGGGDGITRSIGYFDEKNGVFFKDDAGTLKIVVRSFVSGSAVDAEVAQANWNGDKLDGTGLSGGTLDLTKAQLLFFDMEWLGVGDVRTGFVINGAFVIVHTFHNENALASVYMSLANLPIRYEIDNDGTGAASTLEHMCSTVISEGGIQELGLLRWKSTEGTHIAASVADTIYACIGLKLKTSHLAATINIEDMSMVNAANNDFEWLLIFDPTVADTFTYSDEANSAIQTATGVTDNTVTGGTVLSGGFVKGSNSSGDVNRALLNALRLGSEIDGTPNEIVLCVRPLSNNATIDAGIGWRELS